MITLSKSASEKHRTIDPRDVFAFEGFDSNYKVPALFFARGIPTAWQCGTRLLEGCGLRPSSSIKRFNCSLKIKCVDRLVMTPCTMACSRASAAHRGPGGMRTIRQDPGSLTEKNVPMRVDAWKLYTHDTRNQGIDWGGRCGTFHNCQHIKPAFPLSSYLPPPPPEGEWVQSACRRTQASSAQRSSLPNTDRIKREGTNAMTISNDISSQHEGTKLDRAQALRCQRT